MTRLLDVYEELTLSDHTVARDSRVAWACEVFSLEELQNDSIHDVHALQITWQDQLQDTPATTKTTLEDTGRDVALDIMFPITVHPEDSVQDFKHIIQELYGEEWGLSGRPKDRHRLFTGWELMMISTNNNDQHDNNDHQDNAILGNHFFLSDYPIQQVVYAIVRKSSLSSPPSQDDDS
mmetsp:Transcript_11438/g.26544  ORF Transcript_11438/g.26544 Transcript_11438/m.26544 type:complete len:179 (-) Transcript_11438:199-735(-)|eukprot:CAMPEP_0116850018 /NCGR_PEP_ID=MMETSP0418-20121206/15926_1 /TAXON_ID=1158023 /ORGANISM="Astrosyne radiata, Strain 13vi08-1A" /LENGTH=178 /DNA_ID=CAMNT_0004481867 /DNA_START=636 /DNA_END=1172 /DNA_ORIENTATION=-